MCPGISNASTTTPPPRSSAGWSTIGVVRSARHHNPQAKPGEAVRVTFRLHADRTSFTGIAGRRIVEPGVIEVLVGASSEDIRLSGDFSVVGAPREVGHDRVLTTPVALG